MSKELADHFLELAKRFDLLRDEIETPEVKAAMKRVNAGVDRGIASHCGSWLGAHAYVYYGDFEPVAPGAIFTLEWGLMRAQGDWRQCSPEPLIRHIKDLAGTPSVEDIRKRAKSVAPRIDHAREELLSMLTSFGSGSDDAYAARLLEKTNEASMHSAGDYVAALRPSGKFFTRDPAASSGALITPPHLVVGAELMEVHSACETATKLASICRQAAAHLGIKGKTRKSPIMGTKVFIGHGRSSEWKELRDFIRDRVKLEYDEFNRVPVAGYTNIVRLSEMLEDAAVAFIVMTAEDEQKDGRMQARMNVIHEAGLFQGKLGFTRAIVVLEQGCEEFSNINGLGQIRFPAGNIKAAFDDIRAVLEREGIVAAP